MPPLYANNSTTLSLVCDRGTQSVSGTLSDAVQAARTMWRELRPSSGVAIQADGVTIATVEDGEHDLLLVETTPTHLRESLGYPTRSAVYPHNGAVRALIDRARTTDDEFDLNWTIVVRAATTKDLVDYDYAVELPA